MLKGHAKLTRLDFPKARPLEQVPQVAMARAGQPRFVDRLCLEAPGGPPEEAERPALAGVIPDTGGNDPAGSGHPAHLREPTDRVVHEVHDQLGERGIE